MKNFSPEEIRRLLEHDPQALLEVLAGLERMVGVQSPADFAETVEPERFLRPAHVELLSTTVQELTEGRLLKPHSDGCAAPDVGTAEDAGAPTGPDAPTKFCACGAGKPFRRLLVTMPPRHGKSELTSRYTPAWFICKNPRKRVILASYEADFAAEWGGKVRELVEQNGHTFGVHLNPLTKARANWATQNGGGMKCAGAGGPITGKGADLFIIDDPFKNDEEANSELIREKIWTWFQSTVFTRLEPNACIILIQTRWHEDDLAGRVLRDQADDWYHINFPAIATEDSVRNSPAPGTTPDEEHPKDVLGREVGEPLWEERYTLEDLLVIKSTVGSYVWNALYQQNPFIEGGGIIKPGDFQRYTVRENLYVLSRGPKVLSRDRCWRFITVDTAGTAKTYSDYTVAAVFDVTPDKEALLIHVDRLKIESAEHLKWLRGLFSTWNPRFIGIEGKTYGTTLIQTAQRAGLRVQELKADTDKVTRAYGMTPFIETGRLCLPFSAPWLPELESELQAFPYGTHDDMVDCLAYAARLLQDRTSPGPRQRGPEPTREEKVFRKHAKEKKRQKVQHPLLGRL